MDAMIVLEARRMVIKEGWNPEEWADGRLSGLEFGWDCDCVVSSERALVVGRRGRKKKSDDRSHWSTPKNAEAGL